MKKKILAIDDSKAIRFLLKTVLQNEFEVITVPDGCAAMYWLSKRSFPDLIIADPQLPDMNDWELIDQLSSSVLYKDIPVIILSSLEAAQTEIKCIEFDIARSFTKPFNPLALLEAVRSICGSKRTRPALQIQTAN